MIKQLLFKKIDNSALIVFRVFFGLLLIFESFGAILTGWVKRVLIEPQFTFSFIGLEWLQPLPGNGMYIYYCLMGLCGFFIMIGYKYRFNMFIYTLLWAGTYFMQKSSYNNHYYLMVLLSAIMILLPAHKNYSIDAKQRPAIKQNAMPQWCSLVFVIQMGIVYTYASIAKFYPDWLDTTFIEILLKGKKHYYIIGDILQQKWMHYFLAYSGIIFDMLIVPLLLWKPTRKYAFFAAIFFHIFNSIVFQIGVFPYMSLALCVFFFNPKTIRNIFLKKKPFYEDNEVVLPKRHKLFISIFVTYFIIQIMLPLRHWAIKGNVLWTEEGHRMSWRMMLRVRSGTIRFKVIDKATNERIKVKLDDHLTSKQLRHVSAKPDFIWQFSQYLKRHFKNTQNKDVAIYATCKVGINGRPFQPFIDPNIDLASVKWDAFKHSSWILPYKTP